MGKVGLEFLLWSNCMNKCKFCWQRLFNDETTWLDEEHKLNAICGCSEIIAEKAHDCTIMIVGGEVYCDQGEKVNEALKKLYTQIAEKARAGEVELLYANTNLTYDNRENLVNLLDAFEGVEDALRLTTSFDLKGRFNESTKKMFLDNLAFINENYPKVHSVVNMIVTKAVADAVLKEGYNTHWLLEEYPHAVAEVNLIPYIPIKGDRSLDVKFSENVKVLEIANKRRPGYLKNYIQSLDSNQHKELFEYHCDVGYVDRTASTNPCGHNENFTLVNGADDGCHECYICKLKEYYRDNAERLE